jgi:hypothetical protein
MTLCQYAECHYAGCRYADCWILLIAMLNGAILSVIMLSVMAPPMGNIERQLQIYDKGSVKLTSSLRYLVL